MIAMYSSSELIFLLMTLIYLKNLQNIKIFISDKLRIKIIFFDKILYIEGKITY
jgi:hypothetical protein